MGGGGGGGYVPPGGGGPAGPGVVTKNVMARRSALLFMRHPRSPPARAALSHVEITAQSVIVLRSQGVQLATLPRLQVPNDQVGSIIGGQGSNINRIRQTSGARIKVTMAVFDDLITLHEAHSAATWVCLEVQEPGTACPWPAVLEAPL
jgi:KH domain